MNCLYFFSLRPLRLCAKHICIGKTVLIKFCKRYKLQLQKQRRFIKGLERLEFIGNAMAKAKIMEVIDYECYDQN